ncbi:MAG: hypothetical protein JNL11_04635 [Bdellovibrionaceae bacterium]|nr:hypothetical protein [Pseudobdellovibrionaceae bacterium]
MLSQTTLSKILTVSAALLGGIFLLIVSYSTSQKICVKNRAIAFVEWKKTVIPSCDTNLSADWSKENIKLAEIINRHLSAVSFLTPSTRFSVMVTDNQNYVSTNGRKVIVPISLLESSDVLSYMALKHWIADQNKNFIHFDLLHETLTNFLFFSFTGQEPRLPHLKTSQAPVFWKPVQNTSHANCISDWKLTTQWNLCINRHYQFFETRTDFIKERLQHKFNQSWSTAYARLNLKEKNELLKFVTNRIKTYTIDDATLKEASFSNYIKSMSSFWYVNEYFPSQNANKAMLASIIKDFNSINFVNIVDRSKFDLVIFKEGLKLSSLDKFFSTQQSSLVALSNGDDFSIFPIKKTIKISSFSKWYANQIVLESCKPLRMKEILKYTEYTEKLLLIYTCQPLNSEKIAQIAKAGILNYAQVNNEEMFAHFHLPSLVSKRNLIDPNLEVFQFLTERPQKNSVYELFGWRELNWDQISKTYRPKAVVDAVNLFRVQL